MFLIKYHYIGDIFFCLQNLLGLFIMSFYVFIANIL